MIIHIEKDYIKISHKDFWIYYYRKQKITEKDGTKFNIELVYLFDKIIKDKQTKIRGKRRRGTIFSF